MKQLLKVGLLGFLLLTLIGTNCKAEDFYRDSWSQCIDGNWENNAYYKLVIYQSYQKNGEENEQWHHRLLYYSKYAYAFNKDNNGYISFSNENDYNKTKDAWQKELPDYVLKRICFHDKDLIIHFFEVDYAYCSEERENDQNINFGEYGPILLEEAQEDFPDAKELSR